MSGVEVFFRDDVTGKPVPVSVLNPMPTTGSGGSGGSADLTATNILLGSLTETAPGTDTASSGLNGRLQRVAQRITDLIASGVSVDMSATNALLGAVNETAPATDTQSSALNGRLQRIAQNITSMIAAFPASLGSKSAATSLSVTASTEDVARIGIITETAPANDTASSGLNGRLQRIAQNITTQTPLLGAIAETAPASDTASAGLNGRLQRIAQRLTSLIAVFPTALGSAAAASSLPVAWSTEDIARIGIVTETVPASDTASSGLNGRLQRVAQRLTSLIALVPASLGSKVAASSFAVTASTEDIARMGIITETAPANDTASSGLNGRLQRVAQNISTLTALQPASLGSKAAASSFAVTASTEDVARIGIITETAPANDTASSGLNGRLQRIAQRLTTIIASQIVVGLTASGSTLTASPVTGGGLAKTANPTAVADGQVVNALFDKLGKQVTVGAVRDLKGVQQTSITVNTETTIVTAGSSGVFNDIYGLILANRSATGVYVTIKDATAGTTRSIIYVPANDTRGFMLDAGSALVQAAAANNWTATVSSAVTAIEVTAMFVKNL